ncbi:ABC transporter substrate-binding protein [Egicoccus sp. AB-alg6-2]|uniref:ABC transporter substrate-binding protein n=1 Tax=Egicoccus sp. AB-alg6-2 TaxID=3242692 RepID=UPI00359ED9B6
MRMTRRDARRHTGARRRVAAALLAAALAASACAADGDGPGSPGAAGDGTEPAGEDGADADTDADAGTADAPEGDPLRIGMATSLSGSIALFGVANQNGAQLAVDQLNASGGVLGRPVELIVRDDQARPEEGAALARDLILSEGVDVLLGPVSSGVALAITEVSEERKVPFITHTANTSALMVEQFQPYMVSVVPNTYMEARAQGVDLADEPYTRWATIAPNYEFGQRQTQTFVDTITAENDQVEIIAQQFPELGEADLRPFITALISSDPEAVYSPLFAGDLITFTRQAADLGFFEQVEFTALYETDALEELRDEVDLEGVRGYSRCPFTIDNDQMRDFVDAYQQAHDRVPSDWACMAYDAVMLWAQVAEAAGTEDADAFVETVEDFSFTGLRGETHIRGIDHQAAVPSYIGRLTFDDELGFYVYTDLQTVPAEDIWLSEDEVTELRGG